MNNSDHSLQTRFAHMARPKPSAGAAVNPSVTRASTLLFASAKDLHQSKTRDYGRHGADVHDQLKSMFCALEGGAGCTLVPCGLAANTLSIQSFVKSGDHILVTDGCYGPVRSFCENYLAKMGVETEYYSPNIGADIANLIRDNTAAILLESPSSLTLEIQDIPAICAAAKARGVITIADNTWAGGLVCNPLALGADIVVHSASKYYSGHADILMGAVIAKLATHAKKVEMTAKFLGNSTSPDDAYQILRGFRTVVTRFEAQAKTALDLAHWLSFHPAVAQVIHPALADHPQHELWQRDFSGAACLFSFELNPVPQDKAYAFLDRLKLYGHGYSFGGYESLILQVNQQIRRSHGKTDRPLIRVSCGLESFEDLRADMEQALEAL